MIKKDDGIAEAAAFQAAMRIWMRTYKQRRQEHGPASGQLPAEVEFRLWASSYCARVPRSAAVIAALMDPRFAPN